MIMVGLLTSVILMFLNRMYEEENAITQQQMRPFRMLNFTMSAIAARLTINSTIFKILLPMGKVNISAIMQIPVIMRNIRSCRPIL